MKFLRDLIFRDTSRKALALALALGAWWLASRQITEEGRLELQLAVSRTAAPPVGNTLTIRKPDGWVLTQPPLSSRISLFVSGEKNRLEGLRNSGPAAAFDPEGALQRAESASPDSPTHSILVTSLDWNNREAASMVALDRSGEIRLEFEREDTIEIDLAAGMIDLVGEVNAAYALRPGEAALAPNRVRLTGPARRVEELRQRLEAWLNADARGPELGFLAPQRVDNATRTLSLQVSLADAWSDTIRMDPPVVLATIPVAERMPDPVEFDMPDPLLLHADLEGARDWEPAGASLGRWRLSFDPLPQFKPPTDVDEDWIRQNVLFFVDMEPLAGIDRSENDLPLRWQFRGPVRPEYFDQINDALRLEPLDPANATVKMKRKEPQ